MKYLITSLLLIILFFIITPALSQQPKKVVDTREHYIIMQVTQSDSLTQVSIITQLRNIKRLLPHAHIAVAVHGNGLDMLLQSRSNVASHFSGLEAMNVTFVACENTMERKQVSRKDLVPEATTVPSGLVEIILKQEAGWSYVKGGQ